MNHIDEHFDGLEGVFADLLLVEDLKIDNADKYQVKEDFLVVPAFNLVPLEHPARKCVNQE
jgi:hypothetical protein